WEKGLPCAADFRGVSLDALLDAGESGVSFPIEFAAEHDEELVSDSHGTLRARVVHEAAALLGRLQLTARAESGWFTLRARIENLTTWPADEALDRTRALRGSFVGA